jgi:hypothetical protein
LWSLHILFPLALCLLYDTALAVPFGLAALALPFVAMAWRRHATDPDPAVTLRRAPTRS